MPRISEEIQFPSIATPVKPRSGISLYNSNGVLKILHADGTEEIIATGELGEIGLEDYYKKAEVDALISALGSTGFEVVILESDTLPEYGESGKIYLLPNGDTYNEYLYVSEKWEQIGSTTIDLTQYALKTEIPTLVSQLENDAGYLTQHQDLEPYALKTDIPTLTSQLTNDNGYLTEEQGNSLYPLKSNIYTKIEVNELLQNAGGKATFRTWTEV